tara:strand:- start:4226 stop:7006 length:2781 start_codon:yes stop_codon:yes gene_type:complete
MKILLFLLLIVCANLSFGQKKIIDHTAYNDWNSLSRHQVSNDGNFVTYQIKPHRGDGHLFIYDVKNNKLDSIPRAKYAQISGESSYVAFKITPTFDSLRTCELEEIEKKDWPKDSLGIYIFSTGELIKYERVSSFDVNDETDWMAFMSRDNELSNPEPTKKKCRLFRRKQPAKPKSTGHMLTIFNPITNTKNEIVNVKSFEISENAKYLAYSTHQKTEEDSMQLNVLTLSSMMNWADAFQYNDLQKIVFNDQENKLAFLSSNDTNEIQAYEINMHDLDLQMTTLVASEGQSFLPNGHTASVHYTPAFTDNGDKLYFGAAFKPEQEPEDTLVDSEEVHLDLWHYADQRLQPEQLLDLKYDLKKTSLYLYDISSASAVRLSDDTLRVWRETNKEAKYVLGTSTERYAHTYNWVIPYPEDHYRVSLETGERMLIREGNTFGGELSPSGEYYSYYDYGNHNHYVIHLPSNILSCVTCKVDNVNWEEDVNGMPMDAYPRGVIGWTEGEQKILVQSEFDIWAYDFGTELVSSITNQYGSENNVELNVRKWSYDSTYVSNDNLYIFGFDKKTKGVHFYDLVEHGDHSDLKETAYYDAGVYGIDRSKDKSQIVLKKMTTVDYPDLHLADAGMNTTKQISVTNPQQDEYNWVNVELVNWKSYDGIELEGLLYKPEDYDSTKQYPLMVYFYELYTDRLHQHYIPKPTASIIYATEYASAGYMVFMPDIRYKEGHPAKSAYDCILSGTDHVLELYPNVDSTRMALQGQSWGGYQTAQLVTMTNRYKAAMAGAPVTNMFSAYGGIRWGSGLNRQFQYEKTQSRIGYTIWERPDLYVENSPQFHLPNVETPLMIMHNDGDGAVPWYQGIELFTGLKRLDKEAWLLNYNDEEHNLMRNANRIDLSIRMRQFFDHYLQGKEAPTWLKEGIPATVKGKELRY